MYLPSVASSLSLVTDGFLVCLFFVLHGALLFISTSTFHHPLNVPKYIFEYPGVH